MSKLDETLNSRLSRNIKTVSIKFDKSKLDQTLLDQLALYLGTKSPKKLIEMSFSIVSGNILDIHKSLLDQIQYKPAKKLLDSISQPPQENTQTIQNVSVPRWMVLIVGSQMIPKNGKVNWTVEDGINSVFCLCIQLLEKLLDSDGETTKRAS